ncbi:ABC transporter ATP-binding protein [Paraclostridium sordellii]|uniref:ABC transporter ATP-binding protein n=1 Tax=Paraclostridium sordellii TaxID=1505 RepID=UPI000542BC00|nr:ABC transporter ATP-binding protein [Paeniclostridium sordellii]MDU2686785.1 ABC transporter ATP-binding protein [Paeniclostridium sordellii]CEK34114.1 ABC transporter,Lipid A export ATP-binding/permease protein MsbA,lipid transporter ATP-binding/permease protein,ABC-type bacteriocin/lantibiotic exporters, contain an N-terminal double-glycine peptidase domain,lipid A export permease/ATP-binding protein MsbA,ABC transporter transmembrane region [[Clostridium] sordellii] [Paeniclostridium sordel
MRMLFKYALEYKWQFFARVITISLVALASICFDFMMGFIVDIFSNGDVEKFIPIIIATVTLIIVMFLAEYLDGLVMSKYIKNTVNYLRCDIFSKIISKDIKNFSLDNSGKYISILYNDVKLIEDSFLNNIFLVISSLLSFIISLCALFYISPYIVIFIVIFGILGFVIPNRLSKNLIIQKNEYSKSLEDITSITKDLFSGFEVIKCFNITKKMNKIFIDNSLKVENAKRKSSILEALIKGFSLSFSVTIYLGVLILGGYLMYKKNISVGTAIIIIQLSTHIVGPVKTSISLINQIKSVTLISDKIKTILDSPNENLENESLEDFKQCINVENVKFSYSKDRLALDNINLTFEKNKKYAIVGESGCGKSTLIKMIMRYYTKYEGNIVIDNKNLNSIYSSDLYKNISMIQQNVFMFDDSIKENIKLFSNHSDDEVIKSCDRAGLMGLINRLGNGIDSLVGENGNRLSGGEKQRVAIARALINKAKVLILDESTSALDNETAYNLEKSLLELKDLTMIVVTHKLIKSLLISYDEIIVMKDGKVIEIGNFEKLINLKGYFYSLYYIQNENNI